MMMGDTVRTLSDGERATTDPENVSAGQLATSRGAAVRARSDAAAEAALRLCTAPLQRDIPAAAPDLLMRDGRIAQNHRFKTNCIRKFFETFKT